MKRKLKQWWSTIQPVATQRTFTSQLNSLKTHTHTRARKWPWHMMVTIQVPHVYQQDLCF